MSDIISAVIMQIINVNKFGFTDGNNHGLTWNKNKAVENRFSARRTHFTFLGICRSLMWQKGEV